MTLPRCLRDFLVEVGWVAFAITAFVVIGAVLLAVGVGFLFIGFQVAS